MAKQNQTLGIWLMVACTVVLSLQDGISRHLAENYSVMMVVMIRYWFFAAFVLFLASRLPGGIRHTARSAFPKLQWGRGALLSLEIAVTVMAFVFLGLVESHAVFSCYPLLVAALSGPVLGENVGWRRWVAIGIGFVGVVIILQPSGGVFSPYAVIPLIGALMFAFYGLMTRYVARKDSAMTSLFWTGIAGAITSTVTGIWFWEPLSTADWGWMILLSLSGMLAHYLLIKSYDVAEASAVQPFAYLQLVFVSILGVTLFNETIRSNVAIGAALVVAAGVFTLIRARQKEQST